MSVSICRRLLSNKGGSLYQLCLIILLFFIVYWQSNLVMAFITMALLFGFIANYVLIADAELVIRDGKKPKLVAAMNFLLVVIVASFFVYYQLWPALVIVWLVPVILICMNLVSDSIRRR